MITCIKREVFAASRCLQQRIDSALWTTFQVLHSGTIRLNQERQQTHETKIKARAQRGPAQLSETCAPGKPESIQGLSPKICYPMLPIGSRYFRNTLPTSINPKSSTCSLSPISNTKVAGPSGLLSDAQKDLEV